MSIQDTNPEVSSLSNNVELPVYESPKIKLMNEEEVLSMFQITSAGITWWVM